MTTRRLAGALFFSLACGGPPAPDAPPRAARTPPGSGDRASGAPSPPAVEAHRGGRGLFPENSLPAFSGALDLGVDVLEMDVGMTRDGVLVVHHDEHLNPATTRGPDGTWIEGPTPLLHDLDHARLVRYDIGRLDPDSDYGNNFPDQRGADGVRIPRLDEVLALAEDRSAHRIRYDIETKLTPTAPDDTAPPEVMAAALLAALRDTGVTARTTVQSFDWRTLAWLSREAPSIPRACLTSEDPAGDTIERGRPGASPWTAGLDVDDHDGSVPRLVRAAGCTVWSPRFADVDRSAIDEAHALGLRVSVWTVNEPADIERALDLGVDTIITDHPDRVRDALARRGLPLPRAY